LKRFGDYRDGKTTLTEIVGKNTVRGREREPFPRRYFSGRMRREALLTAAVGARLSHENTGKSHKKKSM
jgi:hypothetical protein